MAQDEAVRLPQVFADRRPGALVVDRVRARPSLVPGGSHIPDACGWEAGTGEADATLSRPVDEARSITWRVAPPYHKVARQIAVFAIRAWLAGNL